MCRILLFSILLVSSYAGNASACLNDTQFENDCWTHFRTWQQSNTVWTNICRFMFLNACFCRLFPSSNEGRGIFSCIKTQMDTCLNISEELGELFKTFTAMFDIYDFDIDYACEWTAPNSICFGVVLCFPSELLGYQGQSVFSFYEYFCSDRYWQYLFKCTNSLKADCPVTVEIWTSGYKIRKSSGEYITTTQLEDKTTTECTKLAEEDIQCIETEEVKLSEPCGTQPVIDIPEGIIQCSHTDQTKSCMAGICNASVAVFFDELYTFLQCGIIVNGGFGQWSSWSMCNASCDGGFHQRERLCDNPVPTGGGMDCDGELVETADCNTQECPVNGGFGQWSSWSTCSASCDGGFHQRERLCDNPVPSGGGMDCDGELVETADCNTQECPVNGVYSSWGVWTSCPVTCGTGSQTRTRTCSNPAPSNGENECSGPADETKICNAQDCPVNGVYSSWGAWTPCPVTCGSGLQTRTRTCSNPAPSNGGNECSGPANETKICNVQDCPVIVTSCEELIDSYGTWKITLIGATITLGCQILYEGSYSRQCKSDGVWGSVTNHCTVKQAVFNELHDQVKMLLNSEIDVSGAVEDVAKNLTQLTTDSETDSEVVENVVEIVQNLVILVETTKKITDNGTKYIFEAISNMINPENEEAWTAEETGVKGSKVLSIVDGIVTVLQEIKCGQLNAGEVDNVNTENIYAEILKLSSVDISFPASKQTESAIDIPAAALSALGISDACFGGSYYSSVGGIIEDELLTADGSVESFHTGQRVNSDVISGQLPSVDGNKYYSLSPPVRIKLALKNMTYINPVCVFWDYNITTSGRNGAWSSKGCNLTDITNTSVTCECTHLTNFAILMSPSKIPNKHAQVLGIISAVGCGISMVCLILTIAAHFMVWRLVRSDRAIILMNLCVALLFALGIFLVGIELTESRKVCAAIAAIIQVLFLAVFFFMLLIGVEILICVVHVFVTKFRIKILLPVAWLAPMVIVGISLVVTNAEGYGNDRYCWLDVESGLIWSFIGPAAFVIFVNFVIILVVFKKIASSAVVKSKKMAIKIKTGIRSLCVLLPLMGITWVFGLLSVNSSFVVFQYLFCVMNTLQGLFIFLFHCVFNRQIRDAIRRRQARSRSLATFSSDMRKNSDTRKSRSLSKDLKPPNSPTFDKSQNDVDNKAYDMHG